MRGKEALIRRHRTTILKLGRWTWTAGLSTLPEIAAGAFAQQLLGLDFHPKLLDLLLTHPTPPLFTSGEAGNVKMRRG
jgi:hypothetical protein